MTVRDWLLRSLVLLVPAACARDAAPPPSSGPALLVLVSVDQLRDDLLERYDPYFTGGFRRLIDQGAYFHAAHDHGATETAPGHATLSTGVYPARSGIVANDWEEEVDGRRVEVYNTQDTLTQILGVPGDQGRSPENLLRTGLADWVQAASPEAKIVSVSGKDRSAILMAAKSKGQVYWFDKPRGRFVTSTYYASAYPDWVERFNTEVVPTLLDSVWVEQSPVEARRLAGADTAAYEADGVNTFFPHRFQPEAGRSGSFQSWAGGTPAIDRVVLKMAEEAIRVNELGRDGTTDFLAVGLSQTDAVGHRFGPTSREQLDNLIRLDRELGEFFDGLDRAVGKGRWVVALSADHGSTTMPEWRVANGETGQRVTSEERKRITDVAARTAAAAPPAERAAAVARALRELPFIADAYTVEEIARGEPRDSFVSLYRRSYHEGRLGSDIARMYAVEYRPTEGTYVGSATGTGHGGPYYHDRSVPLIFLGGSLQPLRPSHPARTVDLAPTLARIAGISAPEDLDGRALLDAGGAEMPAQAARR